MNRSAQLSRAHVRSKEFAIFLIADHRLSFAASTVVVIPADLVTDAANGSYQWPRGARVNLPSQIVYIHVHDVDDGVPNACATLPQ